MKLRLPLSLSLFKLVSTGWLILLLFATALLSIKYFYLKRVVADATGQSMSISALFTELDFYLFFFIFIVLFSFVFLFKKIMGASENKKIITRLQQYIDNPKNFKQGIQGDGNGKKTELIVLIDQIILTGVNKLSEVEKAGSILAGAASEMSYDSNELNEEMKQQHLSIEQVATAVNQMTITVQDVAQNTAEASSAADSASQEASAGALQSTNAIGSIEKLEAEIKLATAVIEKVKEESTSIGTVLDVIRGIAEQTNLLALNAAIEAARAGEQGRGFAVVADEVRTLATRTSDSTHEIEIMVKSLDQKTTDAVEKMHDATDQAINSVELVEEAAMSLAEIAGSIQNIKLMNQQVAEATRQQREVSEQINQSITSIQGIAESVVESSNDISETSERVLHEVSSLNQLIR